MPYNGNEGYIMQSSVNSKIPVTFNLGYKSGMITCILYRHRVGSGAVSGVQGFQKREKLENMGYFMHGSY